MFHVEHKCDLCEVFHVEHSVGTGMYVQ